MSELCLLDANESQALFKLLDKDDDGRIGYEEFLESFSAMNSQDYLNKLRDLIGKQDPKVFHERNCRKDKTKTKMYHDEFLQVVKTILPGLVA